MYENIPPISSSSHLVSKSLADVLEQFQSLQKLCAERRAGLQDQLHLYVFEREARELQDWLLTRIAQAQSEDYGQDLEDVEVCFKMFVCVSLCLCVCVRGRERKCVCVYM